MPGAFDLHRSGFPGICGTTPIKPQAIVALDAGGERWVTPVATTNVRPLGVALATAAAGEGVAVLDEGNVTRVVAAASIGRGAEIGYVGATTALGLVAGASGSVVHSVGQSVTAAAAGEEFALYVNPRQLSGLA